MKMKLLITICLILSVLPSFSMAAEANHNNKIIVTLPPLSGLVVMLLPEIQSHCLLSASADPHHFQPSPRQVDMLQQSHLFIRASRDDQGWPIKTQQSQTLDLWPIQNHGWLQFEQVRIVLPKLAKILSQRFPSHQNKIATKLNRALKAVDTLDAEWSKTLQTIQKKGAFIQHPAWLGLLKAKHIPVWSVLESEQHGHEHGPKHLEHALTTLKQHPNALLLGSKRHSNRSLEWLNNHQKDKSNIIKLDALGECNQPWDKLMQENLNQLIQLNQS